MAINSVNIEKDENIDSLEIRDYKIIQKNSEFKFGIDSVILANIAHKQFEKTYKEKSKFYFCDMCAGSGVIANIFYAKHLLNTKKEEEKNLKGILIEINKNICSSAQKTININGFENNLYVINEDIKKIKSISLKTSEDLRSFLHINQKVSKPNLSETMDIIMANPPYFKQEKGLKNKVNTIHSARAEENCSIEDIAKVSSFLLKNSGALYMIHKTERLTEITNVLSKNKLEPKEIYFIHSFKDKESQNFIIKAVKNGKEGIKVNASLIIYEKEGVYTKDLMELYKHE